MESGAELLSFDDHFSVVHAGNHLPFHDPPFFEPLGRMFSDDVLVLGDQLANGGEQLSHRGLFSAELRNSAAGFARQIDVL